MTDRSYCKEIDNKEEETISLTIPKYLAHLMVNSYFIYFLRKSSGWHLQVVSVIFGSSWLSTYDLRWYDKFLKL